MQIQCELLKTKSKRIFESYIWNSRQIKNLRKISPYSCWLSRCPRIGIPHKNKVVVSVEYLARTECKLKLCNSMYSEMRTLTETHFTYLHKIKFSRLNPTRPVPKRVEQSRLTNNSMEPIIRVLVKVWEELRNINVYCPRIGAIYRMFYPQFTGLWDYSIHLLLPKQPVVIYSFLSTDDSLDYRSPSETKRRIFPSTDKALLQMEGTSVDPEGIPDDLITISFLNAVADQKC